MIRALKPIIFLLAFALLIQNTCPFGAAGKSSLFPTCANCPMKHNFAAQPDGQHKLTSDDSSVHFPLYVFDVSETGTTFQLDSVSSARPPLAKSYEDALPGELLRPPQA